MTPSQLTEIEQRANAATAGPWDIQQGGYNHTGPRRVVHFSEGWGEFRAISNNELDMQFISNARTDIPLLCAALREAWKEIESHRQALRTIRSYSDGSKHQGCCPYGCDCPEIARVALLPRELPATLACETLRKEMEL